MSDCRVASTLVWGTVSVSTDLVCGLVSFLVDWGLEEIIRSFLGEGGWGDSLRGEDGRFLPVARKRKLFYNVKTYFSSNSRKANNAWVSVRFR